MALFLPGTGDTVILKARWVSRLSLVAKIKVKYLHEKPLTFHWAGFGHQIPKEIGTWATE